MAAESAYLIRIGSVPPPHHRSDDRGRRHRTQSAGRHRIGPGPLRHCRDMPSVQARLSNALPRRTRDAANPTAFTVLMVILAGATAVSGWLAATGAAAFAGMMGN